MRAAHYNAAQRLRAKLVTVLAAVMPTWGEPAPEFGEEASWRLDVAFTMPFNLTGSPALSVQIVARPFEDAVALKAGHAFKTVTAFRDMWPPI